MPSINLTSDPMALPQMLANMIQGSTLLDVMGRSPEECLRLYQEAFVLYEQDRYEDAMRQFAILISLDHLEPRNFMGFAACLQMLDRHQDALLYYAIASQLDLTDPTPVMHSAECYLATGQHALARDSLRYALALARGQAQHHHFVPRLEALMHFLDEAAAGQQPAGADT